MPALRVEADRLNRLCRTKLSADALADILPGLGITVDSVDEAGIDIEYSPNRPDFSSPVGIARSLKGILGIEIGMPSYRAAKPSTTLVVEESVRKIRPWIVMGIVRGLRLAEQDVLEIITMQEDLHWILGRNRKKASIGIHNLDATRPDFIYKAVRGDEVRFRPLKSFEEMTLLEVLQRHETGRKYAHLLSGAKNYPILIDGSGQVFSFPPIINSALTEVDVNSRNLLVDITGTDRLAVENSLKVLVTAFADLGGRLEQVSVKYSDGRTVYPKLDPSTWTLRSDYARELLGLDISVKEMVRALKKCRLDAAANKSKLKVLAPPYRVDILHEVDFVEEIAIGYGYDNIQPDRLKVLQYGKLHPTTRLTDYCREILLGLGFTETMNFTLANEEKSFEKMNVAKQEAVVLANPVSEEYSIMRTWLLPGLIINLSTNKRSLYPQRLFEVGDVLVPDNSSDEGARRKLKLAAVIAHAEASFTEAKSVIEELLRNFGVKDWRIDEDVHGSFIDGRTASVMRGNDKVAILGEINPAVLENYDIAMPVASFELDLEKALV